MTWFGRSEMNAFRAAVASTQLGSRSRMVGVPFRSDLDRFLPAFASMPSDAIWLRSWVVGGAVPGVGPQQILPRACIAAIRCNRAPLTGGSCRRSSARISTDSSPRLHRCNWMQLRTVRRWQVGPVPGSDPVGFFPVIASMQSDPIEWRSQVGRCRPQRRKPREFLFRNCIDANGCN